VPGPLSGITVIEAANYVAAPSAGALMADLGATVIKIEPPGGEVMRGVIPTGGRNDYPFNFLFELENRGKRSVTIALDAPGGPELLLRLLETADVFLTNLMMPRLVKFGLTPDACLARNPRLVFVAVTGYGLDGPDAARPGFDFSAFWTRSGIMSLVGHPGAPPVLSRIAQGDHTTGVSTVAATLAALRLRDLTGEGQVVDISLQQTGVYTIATDLAKTLLDGSQPKTHDRTAPDNPLFNTYPTNDGNWILLVHMTPDPYWPKLCGALGLASLANDAACATMAGRRAQGRELAAVIEGAFKQQDLAHWQERLDAHGLIWAPLTELPAVVADPALRERGAFQPLEFEAGTFETVGAPWVIRGAGVGARGPSSAAGADTADVLAAAGLSEDEVAEYAARGVFG
jgi:crotonobetainyl-CoA:carnitine CoA-transferase CaiB-like acyl-CoA transferase